MWVLGEVLAYACPESPSPDGPSVLVPLHPLAAADPVLTGGPPSDDDEVGDLNDVDEGSAGSVRSSQKPGAHSMVKFHR